MFDVSLDKLVPDYIKKFEAYVPSKPDQELMKVYGCDRLHRLNNNENPLGPPPAAREILQRFRPARAAIYPSGDSYYLRQKLASVHGLDPDQFLIGNGANEAIAFVIKAFCQEGDNIVTADKTFAVYEWVAEFSGFETRLPLMIKACLPKSTSGPKLYSFAIPIILLEHTGMKLRSGALWTP